MGSMPRSTDRIRVSAVVAMQKRAGIDIVSDGEAGKPGF